MAATLTILQADEIQHDTTAEWLTRVRAGEAFLIVDAGVPVAEIKPFTLPKVDFPATPPRPWGLCKGAFVVPDDFDAPLPENILAEMPQS